MNKHNTQSLQLELPLDDATEYAPWVADHGLRAPYGKCQCGCGNDVLNATQSHTKKGWKIGEPKRFIAGHQAGMARARPLEERFWEKVDKRGPDECWIWQAHVNPKGYGTIGIGGSMKIASRVSWELTNGPIPEGLFVLHNCPDGDNPACVNPAHLWLGTLAENNRDMTLKGRHGYTGTSGESHPMAKLTKSQVDEIRKRYRKGKRGTNLAQEFGVSNQQIWRIANRISRNGED